MKDCADTTNTRENRPLNHLKQKALLFIVDTFVSQRPSLNTWTGQVQLLLVTTCVKFKVTAVQIAKKIWFKQILLKSKLTNKLKFLTCLELILQKKPAVYVRHLPRTCKIWDPYLLQINRFIEFLELSITHQLHGDFSEEYSQFS